jgi:hypothetical protein
MRALFLMIPVLALSLSGCGGASTPPVPVTGKVLAGGKPVEGAIITFLSQAKEGGRSASGRTDKDGTFKLTTAKTDDGAPPGEYTITIAKQESKTGGGNAPIDINASGGPGAAYGQAMAAAGSGNMSKVMKDLLPAKYASAATSGLTRTVVKGEKNEFEFDL